MKKMNRSTKEGIFLLLLCLITAASIISVHEVYASPAAGSVLSSENPAEIRGKWVYHGEKGYYKKSDGVFYRGWLSWKGHIYYLSKSSGVKAVGFHTIGGKRCYFRENSGRLKLDGWFKVDGKRYYAANGVLKTGWFKEKGKQYYLNQKGVMRTGWVKINGKKYYFYPSGQMAEKTWVDEKHYVNKSGTLEAMTDRKQKTVFRWPLSAKWNYISSHFGYRGPMPIGTSDHNGIDIPANMNTPICAAKAGTIIVRNSNDSAGNHIQIDHHNGLVTEYMHMTRFKSGLKKGSRVKKGQVIGYVGSTGWSTGPHLHFGVKVNGVNYDPLKFVRQPRT